ncbi:hypothetical protein DPMN_164413 [Dreissena polymorpha]|uniref:Uncharacterized protein n=1 Tax=Dreissena polymorpha TaxID=45954 RepID=A0A9D4IVL4_DREPO|nr:hypothetical protein DPMN_164413 [Dreissena polymorpha]
MCLLDCSRFHYIHIEKTTPPPGGHVFPPIMTIFKLVRDNYKIDAKNVTFRVGNFFPPIWTIIELVQDINETNVLTNFHDNWANIVTSRVFTRFLYSHKKNTAPPAGGHVFQWTRTIFDLNQHIIKANILTKLHEDWASNVTSTGFTSFTLSRGIIETNVLTKFHEDWTRYVASRVFTRQNVDDGRTMDDGQKVIPKAHHEHVVLR